MSTFDLPLNVDPSTGEILDAEPEVTETVPLPSVEVATTSLTDLAVPGAVVTDLRQALVDRVGDVAAHAREARPAGPVTDVSVRGELVAMTLTGEQLRAAGAAFIDAAKAADTWAGDVLLEARPEVADALESKGGSTSLRYAAGGREFKVGVSQATQVWTNADAILDVIVSDLLDGVEDVAEAKAMADGARRMAEALLTGNGEGLAGLLSSPSYKITALTAYEIHLQGRGQDALANRLGAAYGKRPHGDPKVKVEEFQPRPPRKS